MPPVLGNACGGAPYVGAIIARKWRPRLPGINNRLTRYFSRFDNPLRKLSMSDADPRILSIGRRSSSRIWESEPDCHSDGRIVAKVESKPITGASVVSTASFFRRTWVIPVVTSKLKSHGSRIDEDLLSADCNQLQGTPTWRCRRKQSFVHLPAPGSRPPGSRKMSATARCRHSGKSCRSL